MWWAQLRTASQAASSLIKGSIQIEGQGVPATHRGYSGCSMKPHPQKGKATPSRWPPGVIPRPRRPAHVAAIAAAFQSLKGGPSPIHRAADHVSQKRPPSSWRERIRSLHRPIRSLLNKSPSDPCRQRSTLTQKTSTVPIQLCDSWHCCKSFSR